MNAEEGMDSFEYLVDLDVLTAPRPPPFNSTSVVSKYLEASSGSDSLDDRSYKELHPNCFGPSDISPIVLPAGFECPGSPSITDDDSNAD